MFILLRIMSIKPNEHKQFSSTRGVNEQIFVRSFVREQSDCSRTFICLFGFFLLNNQTFVRLFVIYLAFLLTVRCKKVSSNTVNPFSMAMCAHTKNTSSLCIAHWMSNTNRLGAHTHRYNNHHVFVYKRKNQMPNATQHKCCDINERSIAFDYVWLYILFLHSNCKMRHTDLELVHNMHNCTYKTNRLAVCVTL